MLTDRSRNAALASVVLLLVATATLGPRRPAAVASADVESAARAFGDAPAVSIPGRLVIASAAATSSRRGLTVATPEGVIYTGGDATYVGALDGRPLHRPVVAIANTPSGRGYRMAAGDGGIFTFGDAAFLGSLGGSPLNEPIVGMASTPSGAGYWMVARDGGIFAFGDAPFVGSLGASLLYEPFVGVASTPSGQGYWLSARDGGVFTFGDAPFHGSLGGASDDGLDAVAVVAGGADGYWIVQGEGGLRLSFAGDVHGERRVRELLDRGGNPISEVADHLGRSDLAAVNLETPVADRPGTPQSKEFVFLAPPKLVDALAAGGVDVVSLANNHAMDHGRATMLETIEQVRRSGMAAVGAGRNAAEAYRPAFFEIRGRRVGVLGLSRVVPPGWAATGNTAGVASAYDERASLGAVRAAASESDVVVVLVHWGVESSACAGSDIVAFADRLHSAGATVVAGHHPHVLQGIRTSPNQVTAFSLGNFVWYHSQPPSNATGVLDVIAGAATVEARFRPARIGADGRPRFLAGDEAEAARRRIGTTCAG